MDNIKIETVNTNIVSIQQFKQIYLLWSLRKQTQVLRLVHTPNANTLNASCQLRPKAGLDKNG